MSVVGIRPPRARVAEMTCAGCADTGGADLNRRALRDLGARLIVAVALWAPLADLSVSMVLAPSLEFPGWRWVLLGLSAPLATWCPWPFYRAALTCLRHRTSSMDTLISVGILAASGWSVTTILFRQHVNAPPGSLWMLASRPSGSIYLDVVAGVTTFALVGRVLDAKSRRRAGRTLQAMIESFPQTANVLDEHGIEHPVPADALKQGDIFAVKAGGIVPADGRVVAGAAALDTRSLSGESRPAEVAAGDEVLGGTINLDGSLVVEATRTGTATRLAQLVQLVERFQREKAAAQRLADRLSAVFVPSVLCLSLLTLSGWLLAGAPADQAFDAALAVLIVACPCALGLATPMALLVASSVGAEKGIFLKDLRTLELARSVRTVVFDKTGTLTEGQLFVGGVQTAVGVGALAVLRLAGALESESSHPVASAIARHARHACGPLPSVQASRSHAGGGVSGTVEDHSVVVGSARFLATWSVALPTELSRWQERAARDGATMAFVAVDGQAQAAIALADRVRVSAPSAVGTLRRRGIRSVVLSGDSEPAVRAVAEAIGAALVMPGIQPQEKAAVIQDLRHDGGVAMVGDGVNDGPALAAADLGIAVSTGTALAAEAAGIVLTRDDLRLVPEAIHLAAATMRTVRTNLVWAFAYNLAAVPAAVAGLVNPLVASAAMAASSLLVITNSLRLRRCSRSL